MRQRRMCKNGRIDEPIPTVFLGGKACLENCLLLGVVHVPGAFLLFVF